MFTRGQKTSRYYIGRLLIRWCTVKILPVILLAVLLTCVVVHMMRDHDVHANDAIIEGKYRLTTST